MVQCWIRKPIVIFGKFAGRDQLEGDCGILMCHRQMVPGSHSSGRPGRRAEGQWVDWKIYWKSGFYIWFYHVLPWNIGVSYGCTTFSWNNSWKTIAFDFHQSPCCWRSRWTAKSWRNESTKHGGFLVRIGFSWAEFEPGVMFKTGNLTENGRSDGTKIPEPAPKGFDSFWRRTHPLFATVLNQGVCSSKRRSSVLCQRVSVARKCPPCEGKQHMPATCTQSKSNLRRLRTTLRFGSRLNHFWSIQIKF